MTLEREGEFMGLFKKKLKLNISFQEKTNVPPLDKVDVPTSLYSYGKDFFYKNKDFIQDIEKQNTYFLNLWLASRNSSNKVKKYEDLKSFILFLNDARALCKSKGKNFQNWFFDIIASDEYIKQRELELEQLKNNDK